MHLTKARTRFWYLFRFLLGLALFYFPIKSHEWSAVFCVDVVVDVVVLHGIVIFSLPRLIHTVASHEIELVQEDNGTPDHFGETESLRVVISQLRKKSEKNPTHPVYILTEQWICYRVQSPDGLSHKESRRQL
jgi:hypothetical protein